MKWGAESLRTGYRSFFNLPNGKESRKTASRSISKDKDRRVGEYEAAVLAATFAIHSLEEAKSSRDKNERRKESNRNGLLKLYSNEVTQRHSYNNGKIAGEPSQRKSLFSFRSTPESPAQQKIERHKKLKSVLSWANEKKMKAKNKTEKTKDELDLKFEKKSATLPKQEQRYG